MTIKQGVLDQLFMSLAEYNPTTNEVMEKIVKVMQPIGIAILTILFFIEYSNLQKKFIQEETRMPIELFASLAMSYLFALFLVKFSSEIIDGIVWVTIQAAKWINSIVTVTGTSDAIPQMGKVSWWAKPLVALFEVFAYIAIWLSGFIAQILIFLRGMQLYIVKAMAPILVAFFMSEELRSTAIGYLKQIMALALQGVLLVLILGLVPILTANDFLSFGSMDGGFLANAATFIVNIITYVTLILKYVAIIIVLIGSQGMAKRFIGAM